MPGKLKFNPQVTRIKLNPEQAVLQCNCYDSDHNWEVNTKSVTNFENAARNYCVVGKKNHLDWYKCENTKGENETGLLDTSGSAYS